MQNFPAISDHAIALFFGLVLPVISGFRTAKALKKLKFNDLHRRRFYIINSLFLWTVTLIVLLNWWFHGRPASVIGITQLPQFTTIVLILTTGFIILYVLDIVVSTRSKTLIDKKLWTEIAPFLPAGRSELPAYIFMCITAGVCEEIIFRGFLIPYTKTFFVSDWLAVIVPAAVFAVAHFYQRTEAVLKIFILSVIFGFIFLMSGSLWIVMFLHFAIDLAGGLLFLKYYKKEELKKQVDTTETANETLDDNATKSESPTQS